MNKELINRTIRLLETRYDFGAIEETLKTKTPKKGTVYVEYAEALSVYKQLKTLVTDLDGWDLGILIRLDRWASIFEGHYDGFPFERVNDELISEVGWLKGEEKELQERLTKLEQRGLVGHKGEGDSTLYFITDKGKKIIFTNRVKSGTYVIHKIGLCDLEAKVFWTKEETPQLSGVILYSRGLSRVVFGPDEIESMTEFLTRLTQDRDIQKRVKGRSHKKHVG